MKKKVAFIVALSMLFGSAATFASLHGTYKGNPIVIVRDANGRELVASDVPAINYDGRTMVPISLLRQIGLEVTWVDQTETVYVTLPQTTSTPPVFQPTNNNSGALTVKEIAALRDRVGYVESYNQWGVVTSTGSGFVIDGGMFISNEHVAGNASYIYAKIDNVIYDNDVNNGWYMFKNSYTDLYGTYLSTSYDREGRTTGKIPSKTLPFTTELPEVGDKVFAIGSPQGLENTVTDGIVSGIRTINGIDYIQHTAIIEPGSSGGVLLNEYGEAIGVNTWKITDTDLYFAVPMKYVQQEINKL